MQQYSNITKEPTYSWEIYLNLIEVLVKQCSFASNLQYLYILYIFISAIETNEKETNENFNFFSQKLVPLVISFICSSVSQANAPTILLFIAFNIAFSSKAITISERDFFFKHFFNFPDFMSWPKIDENFFIYLRGRNGFFIFNRTNKNA